MDPARDYYALGKQVCSLEHKLEKLLTLLKDDFYKSKEKEPLSQLMQDCKTLLKHVEEKNKCIECNIPYKRFEHFHEVYLELFELEKDFQNVYKNYILYLNTLFH
jgi:hypothetical protein